MPLVTYVDALTATATSMYVSPQVEPLLGYTSDEWLADPEFFATILHPDDRERVLALVEHCNTTGEPFRSEYRLVTRIGRFVWVQDESLIVRDPHGRPQFTQGYLLDINDRKLAEQRLAAEHGAARVLASSATLDDAAVGVVNVVCDALGWTAGGLWVAARDASELRVQGAGGKALPTARQSPGRAPGAEVREAWRQARATCTTPTGDGRSLVYAVPVGDAARLVGVLEFHTDGPREPDAPLARTVAMIASQVAQFIERSQSEEQTITSEARKRAILDSAQDGVITINHEGRIVEVNPAAELTFRRSAMQFEGLAAAQLVPERLRPAYHGALQRLADGGGLPFARRIETVALRADGRVFPIELAIARVQVPGPPLITAYVRDITERHRAERGRRAAEQRLRHQALHDDLTGLGNRTLFHERIADTLERCRRDAGSLAVMVMDLDRFKEINDTLGHHSGDALLNELGLRLAGCVRSSDTVARLGGDEFGFLLELADPRETVELVSRIQAALAEPVRLRRLLIHVDAAIGIALYPADGDTVGRLLQRADVAMYVAKRSGGGYAFYDPDADDHTPERLTILGELHRAVEARELVLHYQPVMDLRKGAVTSVEALVRWQHPTRGLLAPGEFMPIAERTTLIDAVTRYVIDEALRQRQAWARAGHDLTVSVNASTRNLLDGAFGPDIEAMLDRWGAPPTALALEITEHASLAELFADNAALTRLTERGLGVAIDDFGTGYSSLAALRRLPVGAIKIDSSFVRSMTANHDDAVIVRSTVNLAHSLDLWVIAEGVEDVGTLQELVELGCDAGQGFYLSPPVESGGLTAWLADRRDTDWIIGSAA